MPDCLLNECEQYEKPLEKVTMANRNMQGRKTFQSRQQREKITIH